MDRGLTHFSCKPGPAAGPDPAPDCWKCRVPADAFAFANAFAVQDANDPFAGFAPEIVLSLVRSSSRCLVMSWVAFVVFKLPILQGYTERDGVHDF